MARKRNRRILTGLLTMVGTAAAVVGIMEFTRWMQRQSTGQRRFDRYDPRSIWEDEEARSPTTNWHASLVDDRADSEPTMVDRMRAGEDSGAAGYGQAAGGTATGGVPAGSTPAEETGFFGTTTGPFERSSAAGGPMLGSQGLAEQAPGEEETTERSASPFEAVPMTGGPVVTAGDPTREGTRDAGRPGAHEEVQDVTELLLQSLLSFHAMINRVRSRRAAGAAASGRSLQADDLETYRETRDLLAERLRDYQEGSQGRGTLRARVFQLLARVRDALENTGYTDDDLLRINDEVRRDACDVVREVEGQAPETDTTYDVVRQVYECR